MGRVTSLYLAAHFYAKKKQTSFSVFLYVINTPDRFCDSWVKLDHHDTIPMQHDGLNGLLYGLIQPSNGPYESIIIIIIFFFVSD